MENTKGIVIAVVISVIISIILSYSQIFPSRQGEMGPQGIQGEQGIGFESTGYISIPAAAFVPDPRTSASEITYVIQNLETTLTTYFYGSVQLPHGATITNVTSHWYDSESSLTIVGVLYRSTGTGTLSLMASVSSSGSAGVGSTTDTTIAYASIDNANYTYWLNIVIPANLPTYNLMFRHATIGFAYP